MPEAGRAGTATDPEVLVGAIAAAVLAVPGVVRLEPTLSTSGPALLIHRSPTDGIRLMTRSGVSEVDVSISTTAACQARAVAHQVQASIAGLLVDHGHEPGTVTVSVLSIEHVVTA